MEVGYSKSQQLGKTVNPKKKKHDGNTLSRTDEWARERTSLKEIYEDQGITSCEYQDNKGCPCKSRFALSFAHKNKRNDLEPGELGDFNATLLLCQKHHQMIENDKKETQRLFKELRKI